ncbi:DUF1194 domain-containing protein [Sulfitobacter sp. KE34]|uniref:DUF1194 domain-containing protein n=1 Tax=Sulfitobacter faviae TaxID=1775881 RepID=A0AAX3LLK9_9RHOB|nr:MULTISPECIES: DUF1194 domain-containing protein [Sulfitobacter]MDF3348962.1 DUF1194 domain-containing protein [Sulfitobacter sp. KE12]MDF3352633.1 DUF1194 domain-containing protein [Sulfitobacter sp. KE27]MDF3356280.1 DUF1194 domain-containing protein [Sulfitobacter sp. KE33]MDF3360708.1 DUF1194 domain-containing protein [Sulfitobacter sp. Ks41]MDF3363704.1 DUF1194 domain-containing protein [Sulfitobacter sp. Ks34]
MIRAALALSLTLSGSQWAEAACRQALALGLDVSGSVDAREYRLQMGGLAEALDDPRLRDALLAQPGDHVDLMVYEWSGSSDQRVILPWTSLRDAATLDDAITLLRSTERIAASPGTALGDAMQFGARQLATRSDCRKHTLDISGDGISNFGPRPRDIRDSLQNTPLGPQGLIINGLVIGAKYAGLDDDGQAEVGALASYYRAEVVLGPGAFVEKAEGFEDYARAMTQKLLRELDGRAYAHLPPARDQ